MSKIVEYSFQSDIDGFIENAETLTVAFKDGGIKTNWDFIKKSILDLGLNEVCFDSADHNGNHIQEEFTMTPEDCFMEDVEGILEIIINSYKC